MRAIVAAVCLSVALGSVASTRAQATGVRPETELRAELDGRPIPPAAAGQFFCHDFDYPLIRCYSTAVALEDSLAGAGGSTESSLSTAAYGAGDYLTVYSEPSYASAYAHLSQNYDALWTIGWNDRISSFKVRNSASGRFWQDWYQQGWSYAFCCNSQVPSLSSSWDNQFSSVYRN